MKTEPEPIDFRNWGVRTPAEARAAEAAKYYSSPEYAATLKERIDQEYAHKRTMAEHEAKMAKIKAKSDALDEAERKRPILGLEAKLEEINAKLDAIGAPQQEGLTEADQIEIIKIFGEAERVIDSLTKIITAHGQPRRHIPIRNEAGDITEVLIVPDDGAPR